MPGVARKISRGRPTVEDRTRTFVGAHQPTHKKALAVPRGECLPLRTSPITKHPWSGRQRPVLDSCRDLCFDHGKLNGGSIGEDRLQNPRGWEEATNTSCGGAR